MLYLVPTFFGGWDKWSYYTEVQVSFTHSFQAYIEQQSPQGTGWIKLAMKGQGSSAATINLDGIRTISDGQQAITFPPGYFDRKGGIATQIIPEQTLTRFRSSTWCPGSGCRSACRWS